MTNYTIFRLFDYETGSYIGPEFQCIKQFFKYHINKSLPPYDWCDWRYINQLKPVYIVYSPFYDRLFGKIREHRLEFPPRREGMFLDRYAIKNEYGKNYKDPDELFRLALRQGLFKTNRKHYNYDCEDPLVHLPKNNINKRKRETWGWWYRKFSTANEHRQNEACIADHGEILVRPKRRRGNLPTSWDDLPNSAWDTRKSWKHNSKRRHQWKNK
jgi:hypothetical protein